MHLSLQPQRQVRGWRRIHLFLRKLEVELRGPCQMYVRSSLGASVVVVLFRISIPFLWRRRYNQRQNNNTNTSKLYLVLFPRCLYLVATRKILDSVTTLILPTCDALVPAKKWVARNMKVKLTSKHYLNKVVHWKSYVLEWFLRKFHNFFHKRLG